MRRTAYSGGLALLLLVGPLTATAQDLASAPTRIEASAAAVSGFTDSDLFGLGGRVTARTGRRSAFEVGLDWTDALRTQHSAGQIMWFYFWQMKHMIWNDRRTSVFATYGTSGWIERQSVPPGRLKPAFIPPFLPVLGMSRQSVLASRMAIRLDGQILIWPFESGTLFARVGAGVSVPVRRDRR